jgi:hypothetical protein
VGSTSATSTIFLQQQLLRESGERTIFGPDMVIEVKEEVKQIRANIFTAQSRQKSYTDKRRRPLEFEVDDHVYL